MIKSKLVTYHTPKRYYCMKSFIFAKLARNSLFIVKNFPKATKLFTVCFQYHSHGQNMKLCTGNITFPLKNATHANISNSSNM